ncbi:VOC family protein [Nakamurella endophytica]|uniref:VOC family protein n=1 Tax=Nakamurella endophytica TaxID=1748367 RepID=UPI001E47E00A|nr:VOC family protein [Nakamurella endophytica]
MDLFAGLPVADRSRAVRWYERFLGAPPAFFPNDTEAVFQVVEHGYLYVEVRPERAGQGFVTVFVDDLRTWLRDVAARGLAPVHEERYDGVRKVLFRDPDGNEVGVGGLDQDGPDGTVRTGGAHRTQP